jgi:ADP-ribosylglycohydrolase
MKPETKYKGSVKLSAIGDALGWITEFEKTTESVRQKFGTEKIEQFYDWTKTVGGRFLGYIDNIKAGSYSDDTQLLLAVARSIKRDGSIDHDYFAKVELSNWLDYARGGGRTVKTAADKISRKSAKWFSNFYNFKINGENYDYRQSGANGAAMRILPIALANIGNIEKIKEEIFCNSIATHGHPRAILGAMLYGYAINQVIIYRPEDFNWEHYLTQIGQDFPAKFELTFKDRIEVREWLNEWNKYKTDDFQKVYQETVTEAQGQLRLVYQSIKQNSSVSETLKRLGCFDKATKGSGIATVIAGIYLATKFHDKPLKAIIESVNALGADTDSIAAFTGGLIGALHGHGIIPDKWKSVQDVEYLDYIAERLLNISEDKLPDEPETAISNLKILNNPKADDFVISEQIEFKPLGVGEITRVERQPTLTKGKFNLIIEAKLNIGQTIIVSKLLNLESKNEFVLSTDNKETLIIEASKYLKPVALEKFKVFVNQQKKVAKNLTEILMIILKNEE